MLPNAKIKIPRPKAEKRNGPVYAVIKKGVVENLIIIDHENVKNKKPIEGVEYVDVTEFKQWSNRPEIGDLYDSEKKEFKKRQ